MKKWILLLFPLILIISLSSYIYKEAREPLLKAEQYAEKRAQTEGHLISNDEFFVYHGTKTYYVIIGKNESGTETIVWIPEKNNQEIITKKASDGISEKEAISKLIQEEKPKKVLGARLGMEKELPVWELSYLDQNSKLNYYYIHFDTGKWWRKIENL
ncbi:DUF5590 domain-containing protein [Lederbergia wuyishanensis]|uniref:Uncharacterized protein YpmB n=1 Tax=Lederbergia wuyishanensis TaxID=1347903 RepID=A0ABU0D0V2_9BACI|nr:DUF5590 domain-containing protein [Lederbergia wuyishanensis]MCJ8006650.1 DUF5590 domain-containing protein [Lederbergia wuyishanensis]MDQ0342032.1 uncharacterized protein YpmB [Lederbergia wuyishanensis]